MRLYSYCLTGAGALTACLLIAGLSGCSFSSQHTSFMTARAKPGGAALVQTSPQYKSAARDYARHEYAAALTELNTLQADPAITQDAAAQRFLERQCRLCRHAIDSRVVIDPPSVTAPAFPVARNADCGPRALLLLCDQSGVKADLADLRRQADTTERGTTMQGLALAAREHGFRASGVQMDPQALSQLKDPAIAWVDGDHYVAVLSVNGDHSTIHDPNQPREEVLSVNQLWSRCGGVLLKLSR